MLFFFYLCSICVKRVRKRVFLSVQFGGNKTRWSRSQKNKSSKPLCLKKNKKRNIFIFLCLQVSP